MAKKKKGDDEEGKKKKPIIPIVIGVVVALVVVKVFVLKPPPPPTEDQIAEQEQAAHEELVAQCEEANGLVPEDDTDDKHATDDTKADDNHEAESESTEDTNAEKPDEESQDSARVPASSVDISDVVLVSATRPRSSGGGAAVASVLELDSVTVNLADGRYLKLGLALQLGPGLTAEVAQTEGLGAQALDMALDTLSAKSMKDLLSTEARTAIKQKLGRDVCIAYNASATTVYFTEFVMQ